MGNLSQHLPCGGIDCLELLTIQSIAKFAVDKGLSSGLLSACKGLKLGV
jgi:hypothetical protein